MKIFLTKRAEKNFNSIREFIEQEWGERVAEAFEQKAIYFFDLLEEFPKLGVVEVAEKKIISFQFTKQIRIFYRIKNDKIIVLTFLTQDKTQRKSLTEIY